MLLKDVDLSPRLSKRAYKMMRRRLRQRLYEVEQAAFEARLPSIIIFEGWDAAGKGTSIRELTTRLDPRGFKVLSTQAPRTHETRMPWLWRFWMNIPRRGQMAIFDRSWYGRVLVERVERFTPIPEWIRAYEEINNFERTLAADGVVFVKFWLHMTRQEQLRRFIVLHHNPHTAWQVAAEDWEHHRKYTEYEAAVNDMLASTHTPHAPWTVTPAHDACYRSYLVYQTVIMALEKALGRPPTAWPPLKELEKEAKKGKKEPPTTGDEDSDEDDDPDTPSILDTDAVFNPDEADGG